jgi:hypothetical protein
VKDDHGRRSVHLVRPRSGLFSYGGRDDCYFPPSSVGEGRRDYSPTGGVGQDDEYSPNGREDDCCGGRGEEQLVLLSSSSDKDDSAYHEPLYYNCGSSPSRQEEAGNSGFYHVQEASGYQVGVGAQEYQDNPRRKSRHVVVVVQHTPKKIVRGLIDTNDQIQEGGPLLSNISFYSPSFLTFYEDDLLPFSSKSISILCSGAMAVHIYMYVDR